MGTVRGSGTTSNGRLPCSSSKRVTPNDQRSADTPYAPPLSASGATKPGVPEMPCVR